MAETPDWIQIVAANTKNPLMLSSLYICKSIRKREYGRHSNPVHSGTGSQTTVMLPGPAKSVDSQPVNSDSGRNPAAPRVSHPRPGGDGTSVRNTAASRSSTPDADEQDEVYNDGVDSERLLKLQLFEAVVDKDLAAVTSLLRASRNPGKLWAESETGYENLLHLAARTGQADVTEVLLQSDPDALAADPTLQTALHTAARVGHLDICRMLLEYGSGVHVTDDQGCTPLMLGVHSLEITDLLLQHGSNVNRQDHYGNTALIKACSGGHEVSVKRLLVAGANPNACDMYGYTALMMAVRHNNIPLLHLLMDYGADPCAHSFSGVTALHEAAFMAKGCAIMRELLEAGCDPNAQNTRRQTPLVYAIQMARFENARTLLLENCFVNFIFNMFEQCYTPFQLCFKDAYEIACRAAEDDMSELDRETILSLLRIMHMLVCAGAKVSSHNVNIDDGVAELQDCALMLKEEGYSSHPPETVHLIQHVLSHPSSLAQLSRLTVRTAMGTSIRDKVETFYLPELIENFILLTEINDI